MFVYQTQVVGTFLFSLLANWFLLFCSDLADIQRPNGESAQGPLPVRRVTYSSCPLYSFTLINKHLKLNFFKS